jgi:hypothetical protein
MLSLETTSAENYASSFLTPLSCIPVSQARAPHTRELQGWQRLGVVDTLVRLLVRLPNNNKTPQQKEASWGPHASGPGDGGGLGGDSSWVTGITV